MNDAENKKRVRIANLATNIDIKGTRNVSTSSSNVSQILQNRIIEKRDRIYLSSWHCENVVDDDRLEERGLKTSSSITVKRMSVGKFSLIFIIKSERECRNVNRGERKEI